MQPCWVLRMILCHCQQSQPTQMSNEEYECLTNASFFAATMLESIKKKQQQQQQQQIQFTNSDLNKTGMRQLPLTVHTCSYLRSKHFDDEIF